MYIARILYPVTVLGPGNRVGIWFSGCEHHCKNCSNPELWDIQDQYNISSDVVIRLIESISVNHPIDGFTLTGGDPFFQPDSLGELLPLLKRYSADILCYTGYEIAELQTLYPDILKQLTVLIDGKYIDERNTGVFLRGSDNQTVHILSSDYKEIYENYLAHGCNEIQNFPTKDSIISVGIHNKDYKQELDSILVGKGFVEKKQGGV